MLCGCLIGGWILVIQSYTPFANSEGRLAVWPKWFKCGGPGPQSVAVVVLQLQALAGRDLFWGFVGLEFSRLGDPC